MRSVVLSLSIFLTLLIAGASIAASTPIPVYTYFIVNKIPHDYQAYTQGLVYDGNFLYESTGRYKESSLRRVDPSTGAVITLHSLADEFFGEGITIFEDRIFQLTWQSYTGFVYDKSTFLVMEEFFYNTEGWGITHDNTWLLVSDGSATISFLDPHTFEIKRKIEVTADGKPVTLLNELEFVNGEIFANILSSNRIARIDPTNGKVVGWIDLTGILGGERINHQVDVLNGIAYDAAGDRLFVTGKLWPKVFEIRLIKKVVDQ